MSLMGSLYIGQSGLQTSQNALNTTAHNMSNVDTVGYTRQQVLLNDRQYNTLQRSLVAISNKQTGLGVSYAKVRQVRDFFLDQTYRRESGRSAFYTNSYHTMTEVETMLGEMYRATFDDSLTGLKDALGELAKTPTDSVVQGLVVQRASAFIENAQAVYQGLCDYQDNLNLQIKADVKKINDYGKQIYDLNQKILRIETGGLEEANDLRDARNQLLDELGGLAKISYKEDMFGNFTVQIEGHDFVTRDLVFEIGLDQDEATGFYTPFWIVDADYTINPDGSKKYNTEGAEVFNLKQTISAALNTDIGGTKALLYARGDKRANYTDLQDADYYNRNISQSILMNVQAEFDQLIHEITTQLNDILYQAADQETGYLCEEVMVDGVKTYRPISLFSKRTTEDFTYGTYIDAQGKEKTGWYPTPEEADRTETLYTAANTIVNPELTREPTKLGLRKIDGKEDYQTAAALAAAFDAEDLSLNPNVNMKTGFMDYYSSLVSQIANSGSVYKSISDSQSDTVEATCYAREQVIGVSSDEELTNMIKFQNAYNASSRYINVVNEMLEHLLNTLAG